MEIRFNELNRNCLFNTVSSKYYNDVEHIVKEIAEESELEYINNYTLLEIHKDLLKSRNGFGKEKVYVLRYTACDNLSILSDVTNLCNEVGSHLVLILESKDMQHIPLDLSNNFNVSMSYNWTIEGSDKYIILRCLNKDFISNKEKLFTMYNKKDNKETSIVFEDININTLESIIYEHKTDNINLENLAINSIDFYAKNIE